MKKERVEWIIPEKYRNIEDSKYLNRIVSGNLIKEYKFVLCAKIPPKYTYPFEEEYIQNWSGNWIIDDKEYFLVILNDYRSMNNSFKEYDFRIKCFGKDNTSLEYFTNSLDEAKEMYDLIIDGSSMDDLLKIGFNWGY